MAEIAAHLVDPVFPRVPVRQWVLSLPKRLRYFLPHDPELTSRVLRIFLRAVEASLKRCSPGAPATARFGGVTFVQRFGGALNAHLHFHCCLIDGVFSAQDERVEFYEATALVGADVAAVETVVRRRVLALFERRGLLSPEAVADMRQWAHGGGFSLDAGICIQAEDRAGLERLLRYCARPVFASERLVDQLPKPRPDGQSVLYLSPLELLDRLAALIPPSRWHRHRYHGVLAPNAPLRSAVTAYAGQPLASPAAPVTVPAPSTAISPGTAAVPPPGDPPRVRWACTWALLLARIYEVLPLLCPYWGEPMRSIAFITEAAPIQRLRVHLGEPTQPPPLAPARGPPCWEADSDQTSPYEPAEGEPAPGYEFDQTVSG